MIIIQNIIIWRLLFFRLRGRLYCVIAADADVPSVWTHPSEQFATLLLGTHPRLGACSPVARLEESILRIIHSFVKVSPIWTHLEDKVEQAGLHLCGGAR